MSESAKPVIPEGLEERMAKLEREFEDFVDSIEESFIKHRVSLKRIQNQIKHIPVSLKHQLGDYFIEYSAKILKTKSIQELFIALSCLWDYLNPGLLEFLVGRFGSNNAIKLLETYLENLNAFRASVKLGDYVRVRQKKSSTCNFKKIVTIMGNGWESQTLQDAENFKNDFAEECHIQQFLPRIFVQPSSIAIIICLPYWIGFNLNTVEPLFNRNNVKKYFIIDAIKHCQVIINLLQYITIIFSDKRQSQKR